MLLLFDDLASLVKILINYKAFTIHEFYNLSGTILVPFDRGGGPMSCYSLKKILLDHF